MTYKFNTERISSLIKKTGTISTFKIKILTLLFFLFLGITSNGQPGPPTPPGGTNDEALPVTSFIAIGLLAGAAYGIKKLK